MDTIRTGRLPDFIAVGPPRTATTWLDTVLRGHVGLPLRVKETHFFARNYKQGLRWYGRHFRHCLNEPVVGEICAAYFENPQARERIRSHVPSCKIVITLRDPVERLHSYYKLMRHNGRTEASFEEALVRHKQMMASSRYALHVRAWQSDFGRQNVLVVLNDDLAKDSQAYLDSITDFIGIARIDVGQAALARNKANTIEVAPRSARLARYARRCRFWLGSRRLYRTRRLLAETGVWRFCSEGGPEFPPLDPAIRSRLRELLRPEIESLENLLARDLSKWKGATSRAARSGSSEIFRAE
jgi:sulfotransferase family protein